jgi:hypothetical protein
MRHEVVEEVTKAVAAEVSTEKAITKTKDSQYGIN